MAIDQPKTLPQNVDVEPDNAFDPTELASLSPLAAFACVPPEARGNLREYFSTSPGKYALGSFLEALSDWWTETGSHVVDMETKSVPKSLFGSLRDDPTWPNVLKSEE